MKIFCTLLFVSIFSQNSYTGKQILAIMSLLHIPTFSTYDNMNAPSVIGLDNQLYSTEHIHHPMSIYPPLIRIGINQYLPHVKNGVVVYKLNNIKRWIYDHLNFQGQTYIDESSIRLATQNNDNRPAYFTTIAENKFVHPYSYNYQKIFFLNIPDQVPSSNDSILLNSSNQTHASEALDNAVLIQMLEPCISQSNSNTSSTKKPHTASTLSDPLDISHWRAIFNGNIA